MTKQLDVLGVRVDAVTAREALDTIEEYIRQGEPHQIVTANAEIIYQASRDKKMKRVINEASMVTADGSGVVWASRQLGTPLKERVTGIDLVNSICEQSAKKGWRIYICRTSSGTSPPSRSASATIWIMRCFPHFGSTVRWKRLSAPKT